MKEEARLNEERKAQIHMKRERQNALNHKRWLMTTNEYNSHQEKLANQLEEKEKKSSEKLKQQAELRVSNPKDVHV